MYFFFHELKSPGCPVFIDGMIHERFSASGADTDMDYPWHWVGPDEQLAPLPDELWLIVKDRKYSFDFRAAFNGYIVSAALLRAFDAAGGGRWERARLNVVNKKQEPISDVEYFFLRENKSTVAVNAIDLEASKIVFRKNGEIKQVQSLRLVPGINQPVFVLDEIAVSGGVFCAESLALTLMKQPLAGVELLPESEFGVAKPLWDQ